MHLKPVFGIGDLLVDQNNSKNIGPGIIVNIEDQNNECVYFIKFPKDKTILYEWGEDFIIKEIQQGTYKRIPRKHARTPALQI